MWVQEAAGSVAEVSPVIVRSDDEVISVHVEVYGKREPTTFLFASSAVTSLGCANLPVGTVLIFVLHL